MLIGTHPKMLVVTPMVIGLFAILDRGSTLTDKGKLPKDKYGIYYRVEVTGNSSSAIGAEVVDYCGEGLNTDVLNNLDWKICK